MNENEVKERVEVMASRILKDFSVLIESGRNWAEVRVKMNSCGVGDDYIYVGRTLDDAFAALDASFRRQFPAHFSRRPLSDPRDDFKVGSATILNG